MDLDQPPLLPGPKPRSMSAATPRQCKTVKWYEPYQACYPPKQVRLLRLFNHLRIPHEKRKQEFGPQLTIIGFQFNAQNLTITMPEEVRQLLVTHLRNFVAIPPEKHRQRMLKEWQSMLAYANWALNAYPLLTPALQSSYDKIAWKSHAKAGIYMNLQVQRDLEWFAERVENSDRVHILEALQWNIKEADAVFMCDACQSGMSFWDIRGSVSGTRAVRHGAWYADAPASLPATNILYHKSLVVVLALTTIAQHPFPPHRVAIFMDNLGTVSMFNNLRVQVEKEDPEPQYQVGDYNSHQVPRSYHPACSNQKSPLVSGCPMFCWKHNFHTYCHM